MKRFIVENGVKSSDLESLPSKVQRSSVTKCHILTEDKDFRIKTFFISTFLQSQCPLVYSCKGVICKNIFCRRNEKQKWESSADNFENDLLRGGCMTDNMRIDPQMLKIVWNTGFNFNLELSEIIFDSSRHQRAPGSDSWRNFTNIGQKYYMESK